MSQKKIILTEGHYYHIYNRGNNGDNIFYENNNYQYFLKLYEKYINPVTKTYAWCLLKNHSHILVYIKTQDEINTNKLSYSTIKKPKIISATNQFSHFFNAYTQAINKRHKRTGSLFEKNFERKEVTSEKYFRNLVFYIHNNPVQHGFTDDIKDYPWSSYESILSTKTTRLQRKQVIELFDDIENFKYFHSKDQNLDDISDLLID